MWHSWVCSFFFCLKLIYLFLCVGSYVGKEPAVQYLMEGLTILQNRGYDSAGIATVHTNGEGSNSLKTTKYASLGTNDSVRFFYFVYISNILLIICIGIQIEIRRTDRAR